RSPVQVDIRLSTGRCPSRYRPPRFRGVTRDRAVARISAKTKWAGLLSSNPPELFVFQSLLPCCLLKSLSPSQCSLELRCCFQHLRPPPLIDLAAYPQPMQQHRQLTRYRHHGPLLRFLFPLSRNLQPPSLQVRFRSSPAQYVLGALHQQRP